MKSSFQMNIFIFYLIWVVSGNSALPPKPRQQLKTEEGRTNELFELPIIHLNDFHARFEETSIQSTACKPNMNNCIGGFSRLYSAVTTLKKQYPDSLLLNAGDNFQGTSWYSVHKWNVTQYFMNLLPFDAYTVGNHEFDDGIPGVVPFIKALKAPTVLSNVDASAEPTFNEIYKKSTIVHRNGRKIGIIGVIIQSTDTLSETGKLKFLDEVESVKREAKKLKETNNCDIVIVLSHCGIEIDRVIARESGPYINIIVGGHSHTLLYHGSDLPGPEKPADDYPVEVTQPNSGGHSVLIVQASCYSKYLGFIKIYYDDNNDLQHWIGNPIYMNRNIPKNPKIDQLLAPWKEAVDQVGQAVLGYSKVALNLNDCYDGDCNIGNFIADAMVHAWNGKAGPGEWGFAPIAIINNGGIRTGIDIGNISRSDLLTAQPFGNKMDAIEIRGDHLLEILEYAFAETWGTRVDSAFMHMIQVSGIHMTVNRTLPAGARIQNLLLRCGKCDVPKYEPLSLSSTYRVVLNEFLIEGGDGFSMIKNNLIAHYRGPLDIDILTDYIKFTSPITQEKDDRIQIVS